MSTRTTEQKINNVIGQLEGIKNMLNSGRTCTDILIQFKASRSGISSIMTDFVEENVLRQIDKICDNDKQEFHRLIKELSK